MLRNLFLLTILIATWYLLSGHNSWLLLSLGLFSCLVSYYFYQRIKRIYPIETLTLNPYKLITFHLWLAKEVILSGIQVTCTIVLNRPIHPHYFDVDTGNLNQLGKVIYANVITLTPGTITIDMQENHLRVYSLFADPGASLENGKMRTKVEQLIKQ